MQPRSSSAPAQLCGPHHPGRGRKPPSAPPSRTGFPWRAIFPVSTENSPNKPPPKRQILPNTRQTFGWGAVQRLNESLRAVVIHDERDEEGGYMKRRESKFVHGSPRLSPKGITAAPRLRETPERPIGKRVLPQKQQAQPRAGRAEGRSRSSGPPRYQDAGWWGASSRVRHAVCTRKDGALMKPGRDLSSGGGRSGAHRRGGGQRRGDGLASTKGLEPRGRSRRSSPGRDLDQGLLHR